MTSATKMVHWAAAAAACLSILAFLGVRSADAVEIQEVKSPRGITAWLVEDRSIPLMTMRFTFQGGWAADPEGKEGVSNLLAGMLDEGAADRKSKEFQKLQQALHLLSVVFDDRFEQLDPWVRIGQSRNRQHDGHDQSDQSFFHEYSPNQSFGLPFFERAG